jgi:DNA mismatch endonuclease (patch repair protein)
MPATRPEFWRLKIEGNMARDREAAVQLGDHGWRVLVIWECALRGAERLDEADLLDQAVEFLEGGETVAALEIVGDVPGLPLPDVHKV